MIRSSRRSTLRPPVTRHFQFTRLQDQLIAHAYETLIPVVSRPLERPRSPRCDSEPFATTFRGPRPQTEGA